MGMPLMGALAALGAIGGLILYGAFAVVHDHKTRFAKLVDATKSATQVLGLMLLRRDSVLPCKYDLHMESQRIDSVDDALDAGADSVPNLCAMTRMRHDGVVRFVWTPSHPLSSRAHVSERLNRTLYRSNPTENETRASESCASSLGGSVFLGGNERRVETRSFRKERVSRRKRACLSVWPSNMSLRRA